MTEERPPNGGVRQPNGDWVPRPDPTSLTTEQLRRELATLREIIEARLDASDKATELLDQATQKRIDAALIAAEENVKHLQDLTSVRFEGIQKQFEERDTRVSESATATATAVAAALQAQKEAAGEQARSSALAIDKSELAIAKQIDALNTTRQSEKNALDAQISDIKQAITRIESVGIGRTDEKTQNNWTIGAIIGGLGTLIALAALAATIIVAAQQ